VASFEKAIRVSVDPWYAIFPKLALTYGLILEGNACQSRNYITEIIEFSDLLGAEFAGKPAHFFLGMAFVAEGRVDQGLTIVENIYHDWVENGCKLRQFACGTMLAAAYAVLARQVQTSNHKKFAGSASEKAHSYFQASIPLGKQIGAKAALGRAYLNWGYLHKQEGNNDRAGRCFKASIEYFGHCQSAANLASARKALAVLNRKTDEGEEFDSRGAELEFMAHSA
jgi:tetratricopeptide (TPR) repeat protein